MRSRGLVVAIAIVLAVAAAAAVVLYTQGVKEEAEQGGQLTTVIVASQEIPANQRARPSDRARHLRRDRRPGGRARRGRRHRPHAARGRDHRPRRSWRTSRSRSPASRPRSNRLNERRRQRGHIVGLAVELDAPQGGTGNIQPGDNVPVFAHLSERAG